MSPYIPKERRDHGIDHETNVGDLNYLITKLLFTYWKWSSKNYQAVNDVLGAIEGAKLEFYRRVAVPYENQKISENGDVYE